MEKKSPERSSLLISRVEELLEVERRFETFFGSNPVPCWIKFITPDDRLTMGLVNSAYTAATGISITSYKHKADDIFWHEDAAQDFNVHDKYVITTGSAARIAEKATNIKTKKVQYWVGWKWPYIHNQKIVGVFGKAEGLSQEFWEQYGDQYLASLGVGK